MECDARCVLQSIRCDCASYQTSWKSSFPHWNAAVCAVHAVMQSVRIGYEPTTFANEAVSSVETIEQNAQKHAKHIIRSEIRQTLCAAINALQPQISPNMRENQRSQCKLRQQSCSCKRNKSLDVPCDAPTALCCNRCAAVICDPYTLYNSK